MRIKSSFKDYYDVGMATGQDQSLVYLRYPRLVEPKHYPFPAWFSHSIRDDEGGMYIGQYVVGFCSKIYPVLELNIPKYIDSTPAGLKSKEARATRRFCFSLEEVDKYVLDMFPDRYDDFRTKEYRRRRLWPYWQRYVELQKFFELIAETETKKGNKFESHFTETRCPVFTGHSVWDKWKSKWDNQIVYNGPIKQLEFFRVFEPYVAFQEISMWMGNQAEPRKPVPPISDVDMVEIKGFDKFSFRKDKQKK